jgi:hypothetical protein
MAESRVIPELDAAISNAKSLGEQNAENRDPWAHRSEGMRCQTCMWFVLKISPTPTAVGRCRRHAPTMNGYPVVFDTDWCGDHKLDENKA